MSLFSQKHYRRTIQLMLLPTPQPGQSDTISQFANIWCQTMNIFFSHYLFFYSNYSQTYHITQRTYQTLEVETRTLLAKEKAAGVGVFP